MIVMVSHESRHPGVWDLVPRLNPRLMHMCWQVWLITGSGRLEAHGIGFGGNIEQAKREALVELRAEEARVRAGKKFNHNAHPRYGRVVTGRPGPAAT